MANALKDWFPLVLSYARPWLSQANILRGNRWPLEAAKELEGSTFGVICLTRDNFDSPWLLFEAGVLAQSIDKSAIVPLLLDVDFSELAGPLAQFQPKKVERASILEIVRAINGRVGDLALDGPRLLHLFDIHWPQLKESFEAIPPRKSESLPLRSHQES